MTIAPPPHDQAPTWSGTIDIPAQRQASPTRLHPVTALRARRPWPVAVGGLAAGLAVGMAGAVGAVEAATTHTAPVPVAASTVVANVSVPGRALTSFGDGVWQVGIDVAPGTYTSSGPGCHHETRPTRLGGVVADGGATDGAGDAGRATVTLAEADGWFATSGCTTWHRVG